MQKVHLSMMKNKMMGWVLAGMLFTFPLRDAFGFTIGGVPFRLAEIFIVFSLVMVSFFSDWKYKYKEASIILILVVNFMVTAGGILTYMNSIVLSFAAKYIARNVLWIVVMFVFLGVEFEFDSYRVDQLMRYTVCVQVLACVFEITSGCFFNMGKLMFARDNAIANYIHIAGGVFYRFKGTCSEPGYLAPIIAMPLYYFLMSYLDEHRTINDNRKNLIYISLLLLVSLFSFSSAVYGIDFIILVYALIKSRTSVNKMKMVLIGTFAVAVAAFVLLSNRALVQEIFDNIINKVSFYVFRSKDTAFNFSAVDRVQHVNFAKEMIFKSTFSELLFGKGTGAYYYQSLKQNGFLQNNVSEANNIYLSSMVDRGILGVLGVVATFIYCGKMLQKDIYSSTLFCGIIVQGIHWILTGNFWLYTFWFEIIFLIGYKRYTYNINKVV